MVINYALRIAHSDLLTLFYSFSGGVISQKYPVMVDLEWVGKRKVSFKVKGTEETK